MNYENCDLIEASVGSEIFKNNWTIFPTMLECTKWFTCKSVPLNFRNIGILQELETIQLFGSKMKALPTPDIWRFFLLFVDWPSISTTHFPIFIMRLSLQHWMKSRYAIQRTMIKTAQKWQKPYKVYITKFAGSKKINFECLSFPAYLVQMRWTGKYGISR